MGCWGGCAIFDWERFERVVAPALRRGLEDPIIAAAATRLGWSDASASQSARAVLEHLAEISSYFDPHFVEPAISRGFVIDGDRIVDQGPTSLEYECFNRLFEDVVSRETVVAFAFLGLKVSRVSYLLPVDDQVEPLDGVSDKLVTAVRYLGGRWRYWTHGSGGHSEGLHGFLTTAETREFADALTAVRVPVQRFQRGETVRKLELLRTAANYARDAGFGMFSGGDLRLFHHGVGGEWLTDASGLHQRPDSLPPARRPARSVP